MAKLKNISLEKEQSLTLFPIENKTTELSFTGEQIRSDGGLLLLREVDIQLGLTQGISDCITDQRDARYIDHTVREMISQRVFQIAAGYEDCNDCNDLRGDAVFKTCAGRLLHSGKDLASQPTMSRLENMVGNRDLFDIGEYFLEGFMRSYATQPKMIMLDCDDTNS